MPIRAPSNRPKEAKLFRNNRSQAVRIPVEFELPGDRVFIHREGDRLILEPVKTPANIIELLAAWRQEPPPGLMTSSRILKIRLCGRRTYFERLSAGHEHHQRHDPESVRTGSRPGRTD